jgi:hypothetical protein
MTAGSSAGCSIPTTPRAASGPIPRIVRRPTSRFWSGAGWCLSSSGRSRVAEPCRRTSPAATPGGRGSGSRSSTSSPPRNAGSACSSARSASPVRRPSWALPTWSPTCAASPGSSCAHNLPHPRELTRRAPKPAARRRNQSNHHLPPGLPTSRLDRSKKPGSSRCPRAPVEP